MESKRLPPTNDADIGRKALGLPAVTTENHDGDDVNHPLHYNAHPSGVECIVITRHHNFNTGNAIKYVWRLGLKRDLTLDERAAEIQELEKARWYLADEIKRLGGTPR